MSIKPEELQLRGRKYNAESASLGKVRGASWELQGEGDELTYDALVLDARLRQSLTTVRSLGRHGLRVAAVGTFGGAPTFSSRWCQQAFVFPTDEGAEAYFSYLEQLLDRIRVGVLITSTDATIALIRRHREQLEQRVRIALAKEPALAIAVNKERTLEVAKRLGLRIPRAVSVGSVSEVAAAVREIGLPAVVKPAESWGWNEQEGMRLERKLVTTLDEARDAVEELTRFGGTTLFQEFLSGRRESISFLYAQGQIFARCAQWHTRIVGGQSSMRQSIHIQPEIGNQAERLVREIELEGCSEVEFRYDNAEHPYLMEINPRLWSSTELAVRSGVDFPYLLYQWASGDKIDLVKSYRVGYQLRYLKGDIVHTATTLAAVRQSNKLERASPTKTILDFCISFFIPMAYDYVDWRDPLPLWSAMAGFVRELLRRIGKGLANIVKKV